MMNISELLDRVADDSLPDLLPDAAALRRGAERRSRRTRLTVMVAAAAAALAVVGAFAVAQSGDDGSPRPTKRISPDPQTPRARLVTYADGQTIHWGERTIDAGREPVSLHVTDDGVAFKTAAGEIWFADGAGVSRIGAVRDARLADLRLFDPGARVSAGNAGSRLVWLDDGDGAAEIVVYDTHTRTEVLRAPAPPGSWEWEVLADVFEDVAYGRCAGQFAEPCGEDSRRMRHDLSTGTSVLVSDAEYQADVRSRTRTLTFGSSPEDGRAGSGPGGDFRADGRRLVGLKDRDWSPGHATSVFTAGAAQPVALRTPEGFRPAEPFHVFEWLDDDTVALWSGAGLGRTGLVTCVLRTGECQVVVKGSTVDLLPGVPGINY